MVELERDFPIDGFTSIGIGGKVDFFVRARSERDILETVSFCRDGNVPLYILGGGSNTIFGDVKGCVLKIEEFFPIRVEEKGRSLLLTVSAGTPLREVISLAVRENLEGIYRLHGFPASVGGAVAMNAGAFGVEMGEFVEKVDFITWEGKRETLTRNEIDFGYRRSPFPRIGIITSVRLCLRRSESSVLEEFKVIRAKRKATQPINRKTSGSTFKNPSGEKAGRLLELAGMKGKRIGDVSFSEIHANFLINYGRGTFSQAVDLIEMAKERVREETGISLEEEVRLIANSSSEGWKVL